MNHARETDADCAQSDGIGGPAFALGVALMSVSLVVDQALIGLLRGDVQVGRNALFALTKIAALVVVSGGADRMGLTILSTWVLGSALSLAGVLVFAVWKAPSGTDHPAS